MATVRYEQRSKKAYTMIIDHGVDKITKKRKKETYTIETDDEEVAKLEKLKIETALAKKTYKPTNNITLSEYIDYWFETPIAKSLESKTLVRYHVCADLRIKPWIGHIKLRNLTRQDLAAFYQRIVEVGQMDNPSHGKKNMGKRKEVSSSTIAHHHRFIRRLLNHALYEDEILEKNVALKMSMPDPILPDDHDEDKDIIKVFTQDEVSKLQTAAASDPLAAPYANLITVALRTGMRREELLALRWEDVNFKNHTIFVRRALVYTKTSGYEFKSTKNKKRRLIEVTAEVLDAIRAEARRQAPLKLRLKERYNKQLKLIFCREDGFQSHPDTVSSWLPKFCKKIKITRLGFHCLRHTHASHLLAEGEDIFYVSKRLGHSSVQITYSTYYHFIPLEKRESLKALEKRFKK